MHDSSGIRTFLFSDASAADATIARHRGRVAKVMPEGFYAVFEDVLDAVAASVALQLSQDAARCGIHVGFCEQRDNSYYGVAVNRAAHILGAAHPGQTLVSQAVAAGVGVKLPEHVTLRDVGLIRLRDLCKPERLFQVVAPGLRSDFPPLRSLDDVPNNLPEASLSFVGRTREIGEVRQLLAQHRLVTLLGMGGVGKTRLALHAAAESFEAYPDGVWLVELAAVHEAGDVAHAVASVLDVKDAPGQDVEAALAAYARDRQMLVILDNCEHVLDGAASLACDLLSAGPRMSVLATSREPLHISHEARYLVPGLSIPATGANPRDAIARYFAVRLFVDRAHAASPRFAFNGASSALVASICSDLDGIPLAIELAAARTNDVHLAGIAAAIGQRMRSLDPDEPSPPRDHILHAMIDWSHGLLAPAQQAALRRLAVFAGSWTLEAARVVCAGEAGEDLAQVHAELAGKSLIAREGGRYRMHETVRDYARSRLAEAHEQEATIERHLQFFTGLAVEARPQLAGPRQSEWLARLDAERDNVLAAHSRSLASPARAVEGLRLANAMKLYWMNRGLAQLGLELVAQSLHEAGADASDADLAQGLFNAGQLRYFLGRHAEARDTLEKSLAIARRLGDQRAAAVLQPLGMAALAQGDLPYAQRCFQEALDIARSHDDRNCAAGALNALAMLHRVAGHPERSRPLYDAVVRLAVEGGNDEVQAVGLLNHAMASIDLGDEAAGRRDLAAAMAVARRIHSAPASQAALDVCAGLACIARDWAHAARLHGAAEAQAERSGLRRDAADTLFIEPKLAAARAALGVEAFSHACHEGRRCSLDQALREARAWLDRAGAREPGLATSR